MFMVDMVEMADGMEVIFYPYRSAVVDCTMFFFKAETPEDKEDYIEIQKRLCENVTHIFTQKGELRPRQEGKRVSPDNHTCYRVGQFTMMFSDWTVYIGTDLIVRNW